MQSASAGAPVAAKPSKKGWAAAARHSLSALWRELVILHRQPVFMANCYGYVPVQATLGVYTFWGPKVGTPAAGLVGRPESCCSMHYWSGSCHQHPFLALRRRPRPFLGLTQTPFPSCLAASQ